MASFQNAAANQRTGNGPSPAGGDDVLTGPKVEPGKFHLGYRPSFDGLRGVAIIFVVVVHTIGIQGCLGFVGVDVFFVLSGFLITSLLVEEWGRAGRISLRAFYARRALRLLPALLSLLGLFLIYGAVAHTHKEFRLDVREALVALFYSMNWAWAFDLMRITLLRHTWSLSVEEQFYLIWPLLLILMLRRASAVSILWFILLGVFGSVFTRILLLNGTMADYARMLCGLDTRADALLLGCAVAVILSYGLLQQSPRTAVVLRWGTVISLVGLAFIGREFEVDSHGMYYAGWFLISLFASVLILGLMTGVCPPIQRVFENPALVYVGRISYSLYLWHDPVLRAFREYNDVPVWKQNLFGLCTMIPLTLGSYYLVERPCLRLKKKFQKV